MIHFVGKFPAVKSIVAEEEEARFRAEEEAVFAVEPEDPPGEELPLPVAPHGRGTAEPGLIRGTEYVAAILDKFHMQMVGQRLAFESRHEHAQIAAHALNGGFTPQRVFPEQVFRSQVLLAAQAEGDLQQHPPAGILGLVADVPADPGFRRNTFRAGKSQGAAGQGIRHHVAVAEVEESAQRVTQRQLEAQMILPGDVGGIAYQPVHTHLAVEGKTEQKRLPVGHPEFVGKFIRFLPEYQHLAPSAEEIADADVNQAGKIAARFRIAGRGRDIADDPVEGGGRRFFEFDVQKIASFGIPGQGWRGDRFDEFLPPQDLQIAGDALLSVSLPGAKAQQALQISGQVGSLPGKP